MEISEEVPVNNNSILTTLFNANFSGVFKNIPAKLRFSTIPMTVESLCLTMALVLNGILAKLLFSMQFFSRALGQLYHYYLTLKQKESICQERQLVD
jgi:hypothetical protein